MTDKSVAALLEEIRNARLKKLNWTKLAETLTALKNSGEIQAQYPTRTEFWTMLEQHTGYARNALQRMESTLVKVRRIERENKLQLKEILALDKREDGVLIDMLEHFTKAELFARMYKLDPQEAMFELGRMREEKTSISEFKDIVKDLANRRPEIQQLAAPGQKRIAPGELFAALNQHLDELYGGQEVGLYFRQYEFTNVSVDAVFVSCNETGGIELVDGVQLVVNLGNKSDEVFRGLLMSADYRSSFFQRLWLLLNEPVDRDQDPFTVPVKRLEKALDELGIVGVGILAFDTQGTLQIIRRPKRDGRPPRYQAILNDVVRQGVPGFGVA